ncbi:MAG: hypothetical protein WBM13_15145 [Bacteroidia bacterium]
MGVFWLQLASVFLLSSVKFVFGGVPLALVYGFSFFETVTVTCLGGFLGSTFFVYTSDKLIAFFKKRKAIKNAKNPTNAPAKKFTRTNKIIVVAKKRFGLLGIALLTPALFSIPLGCFLAVRYFKDKQRIVMYMFGSILFWSVTIASFKLFF